MSYLYSLRRILTLDPGIHRELAESGRLFKTAFLNLLFLGLAFGSAYIYNASVLLRTEQPGGFQSPAIGIAVYFMLIVAATAQIFLAHAGFSLLLWAMSRGLKGTNSFFPVYLHTGAAMVPFWLGIPMTFLYTSGHFGLPALLLGALGLAWGAGTLIYAVMASQNLSFFRSTVSLAITVIFIISFRILWPWSQV
ncbi:MAG: YIP1 family protein [Bacillota bacterium]|nr:YIP1 family protein [Bacillota bacterium]MDW7682823.1 YIP1 family protein [Bacillota bacterium]